ncbi:hypothetical protein [Paraburkholderia sediminicola]
MSEASAYASRRHRRDTSQWLALEVNRTIWSVGALMGGIVRRR